jgi:transposase
MDSNDKNQDNNNNGSIQLSKCCKKVITALSSSLNHVGLTQQQFVDWLNEAGIPIGLSTLRKYRNNPNATVNDNIQETKKKGRKTLLDNDQEMATIGYCLSKGEIHLKTAMQFVKDTFNIEISTQRASELLMKYELTNQLAKERENPIRLDEELMAKMHLEFILKQRSLQNLPDDRRKIGSIDVTYDGNGNYKPRSFSPIGRYL